MLADDHIVRSSFLLGLDLIVIPPLRCVVMSLIGRGSLRGVTRLSRTPVMTQCCAITGSLRNMTIGWWWQLTIPRSFADVLSRSR